MPSPDPSRIEGAIDGLSLSDQLRIMERLARRIRERAQSSGDLRQRELEAMASDPAIQRELREIEAAPSG